MPQASSENGVLATNLRRLRDQAGLTQELLAVQAGVTRSTIERIERGPAYLPRSSSLTKIAEVLGCSMADLWAAIPTDDGPTEATG